MSNWPDQPHTADVPLLPQIDLHPAVASIIEVGEISGIGPAAGSIDHAIYQSDWTARAGIAFGSQPELGRTPLGGECHIGACPQLKRLELQDVHLVQASRLGDLDVPPGPSLTHRGRRDFFIRIPSTFQAETRIGDEGGGIERASGGAGGCATSRGSSARSGTAGS